MYKILSLFLFILYCPLYPNIDQSKEFSHQPQSDSSRCLGITAKEMVLKERLSTAIPGSYLVFEQNKCYTFFSIYENAHQKIIVEEVSIPASRFCDEDLHEIKTKGFRGWFERGAPKNTSWTMAMININSGQFEEMYSFTQRGWIDVSKADHFMTTLLNTPFEKVANSERRKIGLPPGRSKPDIRPLWQPRLVVEGQWIPDISFTAWKTRWPDDDSELARKIIELYMPEEKMNSTLPLYPTFFPYVVEVEGKIGSAKIRVVDSGMGIKSQSPRIPLRSPQLSQLPRIDHDELLISLKAPLYFEDFVLLAEEDLPCSRPFPLFFELSRSGSHVLLKAKINDLQKNNVYRLMIYPKDHPAYCLQTEPIKIP